MLIQSKLLKLLQKPQKSLGIKELNFLISENKLFYLFKFTDFMKILINARQNFGDKFGAQTLETFG